MPAERDGAPRRHGCLVDGLLEAADWHVARAVELEHRAVGHRRQGDNVLAQHADLLASEHRFCDKVLRTRAHGEDTGRWRLVGDEWIRE